LLLADNHTHQTAERTGDGYEKRDVAAGKLLLVTAAATIFVAVVVIGLLQLFSAESEQQVYDTVLAPESAVLRDLRAHEDDILNSYAVVDSTKGVYRIPVERAMKLIADEAFRNKTTPEGGK
jgi:hypothetical protein